MAEPSDSADAGLPASPTDEPVDIMNDPAFDPDTASPQHSDTTASKPGSETVADTCRICRSEATPEEPLFYPCKCNGSIKWVHQECLMEWLSHSHKKHCELCKTPFRFTKLYDADMPKTLPWSVFIRRACIHLAWSLVKGVRTLIVGAVWLIVLPWLVRWAWRWMFWFADAGWAREAFINKVHMAKMEIMAEQNETDSTWGQFLQIWRSQPGSEESDHQVNGSTVLAMWENVTAAVPLNSTFVTVKLPWPLAGDSILSSWTYISQLTPNAFANRVVLDIFEGQLITCVVITGFILVFLIREWVVQQQPLVNVENLNHAQRERERQEAEARMRRRQELLEQAQQRLNTLQQEVEARINKDNAADGTQRRMVYVGWQGIEKHIDDATGHLRAGGEAEHAQFLRAAVAVLFQIRTAEREGADAAELAGKVSEKLLSFSDSEREEWELVLLAELRKYGVSRNGSLRGSADNDAENPAGKGVRSYELTKSESESQSSTGRPSMPARDAVSRATELRRELQESDDATAVDRGLEHPNRTSVNLDDCSQIACGLACCSGSERSWRGKS